MEKETSCINTKPILEYVKLYNPREFPRLIENLDPEIDLLPDPESFLRDPNNWISCRLISELHRRAKSILNDDRAPYKMAKFAIENTSLGYIQKVFVKAFWSYKTALKHAQKINDKFNRSKEVDLVEIRGNGGIIRLRWNPHMNVTKDICLYNQGAYTFMPLIWGAKPLFLQETSCYFDGSPFCEYLLKWPTGNRLYEILSRFFTSKRVLMETVKEMERDKRLIEQKYEEVNHLNLELNQKVRQLTAIQETGKAILSVLDLTQLLTVIMNILSSVCRINRALIMLINEEKGRLEYLHGAGFEGGVPEAVQTYHVPLHRVSNILVRVTNTGLSEYIPDVTSSNLRKENIILSHGNPTSVHVVPLITRSKVIGVIATDAVDEGGIPEGTRQTLEIFAPQIAIAIENARLYNRLQEQMVELKRSRALLSRAERFSFLGNLAARLAHEIKNPMTAIGTFIQMLPQKYEDREFRQDFYKIAMEEMNRVNNLLGELLDLVKTKEPHFGYHDLHELIDKMILLISPQSNSKNIEMVRRFDPGIGLVWLDAEKMKQVILNILANAVESTPQNGRIRVSTEKQTGRGQTANIVIEITDNGIGIPEDMVDKIFDPYFTTKHKSSIHNGTGLGLFIAYQNIRDHHGAIEVKSRVHEGTSFILSFPNESLSESPQCH